MATRNRSLTKAFIWRAFAFIILFCVSYIFSKAIYITIVYTLIQIITYYIHERIWNGIKWGKK